MVAFRGSSFSLLMCVGRYWRRLLIYNQLLEVLAVASVRACCALLVCSRFVNCACVAFFGCEGEVGATVGI